MAIVKDPVRPGDREEVYRRDGGCIAPQIDPSARECHNKWGRAVSMEEQRAMIEGTSFHDRQARAVTLTLDHVPRTLGSPRISTPRWMVTACWGHGVANGPGGSVWVTGHRPAERSYLERIYGKEPEQ